MLNLKINKNWKLNYWKCWSVHTCPQSSWKPQLSLLWTSQYCLAGCRWQVSMEIYAPPEKRQFSKFSILKMHPWDVGVLVFFYSNTNWTKITVRSFWMLKSVSSHIFLVWRMSRGHRLVRLLSCHIIGINILFLPAASSQGTFHKMTQHKKQYTTLYCILKQLGDVHRQCLIFYLTNIEVHSCQSWGTRCKKARFLGGVCIFYFSLMAWMNQLFHLRSELYSLRLDGELPLEFFLAAGSKSFNWEDWVVARSSLSETKVADKI